VPEKCGTWPWVGRLVGAGGGWWGLCCNSAQATSQYIAVQEHCTAPLNRYSATGITKECGFLCFGESNFLFVIGVEDFQ
jgi:hypothetical protein